MLNVQLLHANAQVPVCAHPGEDLGYDIFAVEDTIIRQGPPTKVRTGLAMCFLQPPNQFGLMIMDRSSMAKKGLYVVGGMIDAGYRGEVHVLIGFNHYDPHITYKIYRGDKIAQLVPQIVYTFSNSTTVVDSLPPTQRGKSGFGSTGE